MTKTGFLGDKPINRIGLGAMQLAGPGVFGPPADPVAAREVLRRAIELGVDHIDTAQYYGRDVVNDLIRETLAPHPDGLKLVTKVGARRDRRGAWMGAQTPAELRAAVEDNLRSLGVERMDLVNLRLLDGHSSPVPLADQLGELEDLRSAGKLDLIGISNVGIEVARQALALAEISSVQNSYSIVNRADEPIVERCRGRQIAYVPFFPLGSAFRAGPVKLAQDPTISSVATKHGATASQIALGWLLARYRASRLRPASRRVRRSPCALPTGSCRRTRRGPARQSANRAQS